MKKTNFVIFLILVISSSTLLATNSKCYSIANKVKDASIFYPKFGSWMLRFAI
jgi:hypothetical protein